MTVHAADRASTLAEELEGVRFTLALSAGFFGFFAHAGCLAALVETGLVPAKVVGVSAGALTGGLFAAGVPVSEIRRRLFSLRKDDFWDPGLHFDGFLAGRKFRSLLTEFLGEAPPPARALPVPLATVAYDLRARRPVVLSRVPADVAIRASCAVPFMFRPVRHGGRIYVDGGVADRVGRTAATDPAPVLCHLLPSRSPWRLLYAARGRHAVGPPSWHVVSTFAPRVGPNRLGEGRAAYQAGYASMRDALAAPPAVPLRTAPSP